MSEKPKMSYVKCLKTYFERQDEITPGGGRRLGVPELKDLTVDERRELALMAAEVLGVEAVAATA